MPPRVHAVRWNVGIQDKQLEFINWLSPSVTLSARLRQMQQLVVMSRADIIMFQECGNHTTIRSSGLVRKRFMIPLRLDDEFALEVNQSYWTLFRKASLSAFVLLFLAQTVI